MVVFVSNHEGMSDYQHVIPVHADVARGKKRNWSELEEMHFGDYLFRCFLYFDLMFEVCLMAILRVSCLHSLTDEGDLMYVDHGDVMIIVPPIFAPKDVPENLV